MESTNEKLTSELTVLKERQTSVEVLKEQKRGLEKRLQVLEEFRIKDARLEAEVEVGRRERGDWYLFSFHSIIFTTTLTFICLSLGLVQLRFCFLICVASPYIEITNTIATNPLHFFMSKNRRVVCLDNLETSTR